MEKKNEVQLLVSNIEELKEQIKEHESNAKLEALEKQNRLLHDELERNQNNLQLYQEEINKKELKK